MDDLVRGPVLLVDDGTPAVLATFARAVPLATSVTVALAHGSPNLDALRARSAETGLVLEPVPLEAHTGIRHAIGLCGPRRISWVFVPNDAEHPGRLLRKCLQAAAAVDPAALPALAVVLTTPGPAAAGPVLEVNRSGARSGFVSLFASRLAAATAAPLTVLDLGAADDPAAEARTAAAAEAADELLRVHRVPVRPLTVDADAPAAACWAARGTRAAVVGLGGFTAGGRKLGAPDELGDEVLRTPDGRVAHELARQAASDVVVVVDEVTISR